MSDLVFVLVIVLVLAGVGLGVAVTALLLLRAGERRLAAMQAEQDAKLAAAEARITADATAAAVEKALGMVKDIVGNRAAPDTALNRFEAAVKAEAEHTAWVRRMELDRAQADVLLNKGEAK